MIEISNSEIKTFQRCPRQWALTYHWKWQTRPDKSSPIGVSSTGTRIHLALEAWYGYGIDPIEALTWAYDMEMRQYPEYKDELEKDMALALAMVEGYVEWVAEEGIDVGFETLEVEKDLRVTLTTPFGDVIIRGKLDQLIRRKNDGALLLRDFKTVGTLAKANRLIIDQQMRHYSMLLALLYPNDRVDGALYMMLKRSKRTMRATPPFYHQVEINYNRHDLNSTYLRVKNVAGKILETHQQLDSGADHRAVVYANDTESCDWKCPFYTMCPLMDDGSRWESALAANFVQGDPYSYYEHDTIQQLVNDLGQ